MIVAPVPNSRRASSVDTMRICLSVGSRASSASLPGSTWIPFERIEETSGMDSVSSVTIWTMPLRMYSLSKIVHPANTTC